MQSVSKNISKSTFLAGLICFTKAWRLHCQHKQESTIGEQLRIDEGNQIGALARSIHPNQGWLIKMSPIVQYLRTRCPNPPTSAFA